MSEPDRSGSLQPNNTMRTSESSVVRERVSVLTWDPAALADVATGQPGSSRGHAQTCSPLCTPQGLGPRGVLLYAGHRTSFRWSQATCPRGVPRTNCPEEHYKPTHKCLSKGDRDYD